MKNIVAGIIIVSGGLLFILSSCDKNNTSNAAPASTLSVIKSDPALSIFSVIESLSGDDNYVNNSPAIAIPVDSAFKNAGITPDIAAALSPVMCDSIVKYYTTTGDLNFNGTMDKQIAFSTDLGTSLFVDSTTTTLYFDGIAAVSPTPAKAGSTDIYKLTQFINVPVATVAQLTAADSSLSLFNEAYNRTRLSTYLSPYLGTGSFTILMPTNVAFANAGLSSIKKIDAVDINTLTKILLYHVISNNHFTNELTNQTTLSTLEGGKINVGNNGNVALTGNSNPSSPASLLNNGTLAGNVLAYKINTVLLP